MERFSKILLCSLFYWLLFNTGICLAQDRECLISKAESYIGVREATGHNDGEQVEVFLKLTGFGPGAPWCSAFVSYIYKSCEVKAPITAWSPSWANKEKAVYNQGEGYQIAKKKAQAGDVFTIYYSSKGRVGHVGIYLYSTPSRVYTIEGNTNKAGSREGDGVYRKIRTWNQVYMITSYLD